ncbi:MAG: XRE family transcriptional regulator [Candidatus Omnitrophota bacterium]|jgi:transcriptional regulator with XRE-family HTH domain|nr:MAG: XRE family transcriptional regulator [Candidatus Omnitrophota bacterium]
MKGAFRITGKLNKWMELKGWNQRQLALELGCDDSLISQWLDEKKPKHPSWQMLRKLCLLTGLDASELLTLDREIEQED